MLRDVHAIPRTAALHHRLAGAREYRTASGHRVLVRHGRLGRLGEHARYARILLARARPATAGGGTLSAVAPAPTDHLLLLALHRLYARPSFHMSDLPSVIKTIRGGDVEWDYLFATSLSLGVLPAVGCYLQYVDRLHRALLDAPLVSADTLARFDAVSGERGTEFPRVGTAARVYLRHVRATIESGRWHSAIRLSLLPLMAALTAGTTGPRRTA
jgi:hypothetical protein